MKKFLPPFLLALALIGGFTACNSPESTTAGLKLELTSIERAGDGTVRVAWRVQNPNVFPYLLSKTASKLSLNGTLVATLTDDSPLGVPAQSRADRTAELKLANATATAVVDQAVAQGSAAYRVDSILTVLLLDEQTEKIRLTVSGTVPVTAK